MGISIDTGHEQVETETRSGRNPHPVGKTCSKCYYGEDAVRFSQRFCNSQARMDASSPSRGQGKGGVGSSLPSCARLPIYNFTRDKRGEGHLGQWHQRRNVTGTESAPISGQRVGLIGPTSRSSRVRASNSSSATLN